MKKRITRIGQQTDTVAVLNSKPDCRFVPGWDKAPGAQQQIDRNAARHAMGQKRTPLGRGTLKPAR